MVGRNRQESGLACRGGKLCQLWPEKCLQIARRKGASPESYRRQAQPEPAPTDAGQISMIGENLQNAVGSRHRNQKLPGDLARPPFRTVMAEQL
jgi:hypothetical protein